jgi:hypothetical protein
MDRVEYHRQIVREVLSEYHRINEKSSSPVENFLVFDEAREQYLLLLAGWQGEERIKNTMVHVRLRDGKIWIEEDWTEDGVATDLLQKGIRQEEIVLAFHPPHLRQHTEFAFA